MELAVPSHSLSSFYYRHENMRDSIDFARSPLIGIEGCPAAALHRGPCVGYPILEEDRPVDDVVVEEGGRRRRWPWQ
jgi:hypothetical protein